MSKERVALIYSGGIRSSVLLHTCEKEYDVDILLFNLHKYTQEQAFNLAVKSLREKARGYQVLDLTSLHDFIISLPVITTLAISYAVTNNIKKVFIALEDREELQALQKLSALYGIELLSPFSAYSLVGYIELAQLDNINLVDTWSCDRPAKIKEGYYYEAEPAGGRNSVSIDYYEPCGSCPKCFERSNAFKHIGVIDPREGVWDTDHNIPLEKIKSD